MCFYCSVFCLQIMSQHLSLLVSVVGLSGCGPDVYKGPGKSSLCFNLLHPTEYLKEHPSILTFQQFESKVIDKQHYVYWGTKTEYYNKLPKSKKSTGEKILVTVNFEIFEQTEFIEDATRKAFPAKHEYPERAMKLPRSSNKLSFKTVPLVTSPEKYHATVSPNTKGMKNGYIFAIDVSKGCPTFHHQLRLLKKMVRPHKKVFVIAATKFDQVDETFFEEVKIAGKEFGVEVIPTSVEMEDGRFSTDVFKYLAIKLFNLQTEESCGVAGDAYLRYAEDPPPTKAPPPTKVPKKKVEPIPMNLEPSQTPPIPPRYYGPDDIPLNLPPASFDDPGYVNFIQKQMEKTKLDQTLSKSDPDLQAHTTEIPPNILARKPKTLDRRANQKRSMSTDANTQSSVNSAPMTLLPEPSSAPPLPPKPKSPREVPIAKSPIVKSLKSPLPTPPPVSIQKASQAMAARPLPELPFVSNEDEDTNHYIMRRDYDTVDYTKMKQVRQRLRSGGGEQRSKVKAKLSSHSCDVPARNIPRKKEELSTTSSEPLKRKPPPVAKKPSVKPRKKQSMLNSPVKPEQHTSQATKQEHGARAESLEYEDTVTALKNFDYDTGYINEGHNKLKAPPKTNQPNYPPRCIPRKFYFLNGRRAIPDS